MSETPLPTWAIPCIDSEGRLTGRIFQCAPSRIQPVECAKPALALRADPQWNTYITWSELELLNIEVTLSCEDAGIVRRSLDGQQGAGGGGAGPGLSPTWPEMTIDEMLSKPPSSGGNLIILRWVNDLGQNRQFRTNLVNTHHTGNDTVVAMPVWVYWSPSKITLSLRAAIHGHPSWYWQAGSEWPYFGWCRREDDEYVYQYKRPCCVNDPNDFRWHQATYSGDAYYAQNPPFRMVAEDCTLVAGATEYAYNFIRAQILAHWNMGKCNISWSWPDHGLTREQLVNMDGNDFLDLMMAAPGKEKSFDMSWQSRFYDGRWKNKLFMGGAATDVRWIRTGLGHTWRVDLPDLWQGDVSVGYRTCDSYPPYCVDCGVNGGEYIRSPGTYVDFWLKKYSYP